MIQKLFNHVIQPGNLNPQHSISHHCITEVLLLNYAVCCALKAVLLSSYTVLHLTHSIGNDDHTKHRGLTSRYTNYSYFMTIHIGCSLVKWGVEARPHGLMGSSLEYR